MANIFTDPGAWAQDQISGLDHTATDLTNTISHAIGNIGNAIDKITTDLGNYVRAHPLLFIAEIAGAYYAYTTLSAAQSAAAAGGGAVLGQGQTAATAATASSTTGVIASIGNIVSGISNTIKPMVDTIGAAVHSITDIVTNINSTIIQPIVGPITTAMDQYKALSTAIEQDISGGLKGILQIPSDIANAFTSVDAAFQRAMQTLAAANADATANILVPSLPNAALKGLQDHTETFRSTFPGYQVPWAPPGKVKLTEDWNVEELTKEIDDATAWLNGGDAWYKQIGITLLKIATLVQGQLSKTKPILSLYEQEAYKHMPALNLSTGDVVTLFRMGIIGERDALDEIASNGLNAARARALIESATTYPDLATASNLYKRTLITEASYDSMLVVLGYDMESIAAIKKSLTVDPNPEQSLDWWRKGIIPRDDLEMHLLDYGYPIETAQAVIAASDTLPDIQSIIQAVSNQALITSGVASTSLNDPAPAILAQQAFKLGLNTDLANLAWQLHYQPLPLGVAIICYWRGMINKDQIDAHFDAAGLVPEQRQNYLESQRPRLSFRQLQTLRKQGTIDDITFRAEAEGLGYDLKQIQWMDALDTAASTAPATPTADNLHGLTQSTVLQLYDAFALDRATAADLLTQLGDGPQAVDALLTLHDVKNYQADQTASADLIKSQALAGLLTYAEAQGQLGALGLSTTQLNKILASLQGQLTQKVKIPSESIIMQMYRHGILDRAATASGVELNGYSSGWTELLIQLEETTHGVP